MLAAIYATALDIVVCAVYVAGLLAMLGLSATYNLWPVSRAKWVLRRFDHSAIYVLIAATYTPFIMEVKENLLAVALLVGVWCAAIAGIVLKLKFPGRFDRLAVGLYLAMGWSGMMLYDSVVAALPTLATLVPAVLASVPSFSSASPVAFDAPVRFVVFASTLVKSAASSPKPSFLTTSLNST